MNSPLPRLLVSLNHAEEKIKAQIDRGRQISNTLLPSQREPNFDQLAAFWVSKKNGEQWSKYTIDLLKNLVADLSIDKEFGLSDFRFCGDNQIIEFLDWMDQRLNSLDSILQRLPLFSLVDTLGGVPIGPTPSKQQSKDIFIVHGHDDAAKQEVARFIEKLGLNAIVLHERPDRGKTVIEKFEHHSNVGFAVVLLTPDDMGHPKDTPSEAKPRARQNVVLELGYFIGILGRSKVCALLKGAVEIPSDYLGVIPVNMDDAGAWQFRLARELHAAGINVDLNRLR